MLWDPKWEKQTKADPKSLQSFIAWLETKNPDESYSYMNCRGACLVGQYMAHHGVVWSSAGFDEFADPFNNIAASGPYTFGAALERARNWSTAR